MGEWYEAFKTVMGYFFNAQNMIGALIFCVIMWLIVYIISRIEKYGKKS
jgi:small-conductance mechanosensitive channel